MSFNYYRLIYPYALMKGKGTCRKQNIHSRQQLEQQKKRNKETKRV